MCHVKFDITYHVNFWCIPVVVVVGTDQRSKRLSMIQAFGMAGIRMTVITDIIIQQVGDLVSNTEKISFIRTIEVDCRVACS